MKKQTLDDLIPRDGVIFGCALGILIPAFCVFIYFFISDGMVAAVYSGLFTLGIVGIFSGPLGMVIGAYVAAAWRFSDEERRHFMLLSQKLVAL